MVAIMGISCSANATAPADFSETEDFIEVPAPEVKPEQTPQKPVLPIDKTKGAVQFDGKTFENEKLTVKIETRKNPAVSDPYAKVTWGVSLTGGEYQFHANTGASEYNITHNGRDGRALFTKDGSLKIWFNNNQSDLITLKLTQKDETPSVPEVKPEETPTGPVLPIKKWGVASQFIGLTFKNETLTATIEGRAIENQLYSRVFAVITGGDKGEEYEIHFPKGDSLYAVTHNGRNGSALFSESGSLKIWFNNNQSDLITLQLVK